MNAKTKQANCELLASESTGSESYHKVSTPTDLKLRELKEADTDENPVRVREVNRRRADKTGVRPCKRVHHRPDSFT
jgi:hypothetical protein